MWRPPEWKADFSARRRTCRSGLLMAAVPRLNEIDEQQRREGRRQRDGGNGRRPAIIILLQFDHDQARGEFRLERPIPGKETDRTISAPATPERHCDTSEQRRPT